ncbi:MAG: DegQ family serine endoprotease [Acidobacteria bacterium]|nr:DegQ family serine endoprotease [Acidobacteriota bacterium]
MKPKGKVVWAASGALIITLALIFSFSHIVVKVYGNKAPTTLSGGSTLGTLPPPKEITLPEQVVSPSALSNTFREIAKVMKPTVVNISTVQKVKGMAEGMPKIPGFEFDFPGQSPQPFKQRGNGSGVLVTQDGYILTNNHVVGKADSIEVKLVDGTKLKGKVIGKDELTDLAVVKIDTNNLPYASLGDSDGMEQGDWVVAIGSPFGLEQTITAGIVSAKGRYVGSTYNEFIQTDASINPGNSGGPLVNMKGQVIGINTMIFSESGGNQGIGFAIPSNLVRNVYEQIVKNGKVTRGYLGVTITEVTPEKAKGLGLNTTEGALVNDVQPNTPAAKAGIQSGDLIISFDGTSVKNQHELTNTVARTAVGKKVEVKFIRDGKTQSAIVETAERKIGANPNLDDLEENLPEEKESSGKLGLSASTLNAEQAAELKIKSGVVVDQVTPGGPAAEIGLRKGDVIHQINRQTIKSVTDLTNAMKSVSPGDTVILQVERKGTGITFLPVTIE